MEIHPIAQVPTIQLSSGQRALARIISLRLNDENPSTQTQNGIDLGAEGFWSCFLPEPETVETIPAERSINRRILDWATKSQSWQSTHLRTSGSLLSSICASEILFESLTSDEVIKEALKKEEEAQKEQEKANQKAEEAQQARENGDEKKAQQAEKEAERYQKAAQALNAQASEKMDSVEKDMVHQAIRANAVRQAQDAAKEAETLVSTWGNESAGLSVGETNELLSRMKNNPHITRFTQLMGRVKGMSLKARPQQEKRGLVIVQDGYTQQLPNIFVSGLALLRPDANPMLRAQSYAEYCDRGLLGMVPGNEGTESGRLVVMVDRSGSMHGKRLQYAQALAVGISEAAKEHGQPYTATYFDDMVHDETVIREDDSFLTKIGWAEILADGGTSFDNALKFAIREIRNSGDRASNADILFVTDGECRLSDGVIKEYVDLKDLFGTRLIVLVIDHRGIISLETLADAVIHVDNIDDIDHLSGTLTNALERKSDESH